MCCRAVSQSNRSKFPDAYEAFERESSELLGVIDTVIVRAACECSLVFFSP